MVKSTPIAQIIQPSQQPSQQQQTITQPPPQQQYQEDTNEDINIEDLVQEKERLSTIQHKQQSELQNQIDILKREIEMNKSNIPSPSSQAPPAEQMSPSISQTQPIPQSTSQSMTDSFINKNALLSIVGDLDYFLFVIVVFIVVVVYSESVRSFIFQKLELKNLSYLTPYTQAFLSALLVVLIKKLN